MFLSQATPGRGIKEGEFIKENRTGRFRQGINIHTLENTKPLTINFDRNHNHLKLSHEYIVMHSMKTVSYHDYMGKIFTQCELSAYYGCNIAGWEEHAILRGSLQQLPPQPCRNASFHIIK